MKGNIKMKQIDLYELRVRVSIEACTIYQDAKTNKSLSVLLPEIIDELKSKLAEIKKEHLKNCSDYQKEIYSVIIDDIYRDEIGAIACGVHDESADLAAHALLQEVSQ
jgi:hypothetical protein